MKFSTSSELMLNQKHAEVMSPDKAFEVLQTQSGQSLFFSIGTDDVFYVTREVGNSVTGWEKVDLSSRLSSSHGGKTVAAKRFDISQNSATMAIDLILAITVDGEDFLHVSTGNPADLVDWSDGVEWTAMPWDGGNAPSPLTITNVYHLNIATSSGPVLTCFVEVLRNPGHGLELIDRYYLDFDGLPRWHKHALAIDFSASSVVTALGQRPGDFVSCIYSFGSVNGVEQMIACPRINAFRPGTAPSPARLSIPDGTTYIASCSDGSSSGNTNLFVAAPGGLYMFAPNNQKDFADPVLVLPSPVTDGVPLFAGVTRMAARVDPAKSRTVLWCRNAQGNLFYVSCPTGQEATQSAWSTPVPLYRGVEDFAFYLNVNHAYTVLFAQISGQQIVQLTQDPTTSVWSSRTINLPPTSVDKVVEFQSFTTQLTLEKEASDDENVLVGDTDVYFTSTSPVSIYINNEYYVLSPSVPIPTRPDASGAFTIIQATDSLAAVQYQARLTPSGAPLEINPLAKAFAKLEGITSGDDLADIQIPTGTNWSSTKPLLPSDANNSETRDALAQAVSNLLEAKSTLPSDGSVQDPQSTKLAPAARSLATPRVRTWGLSFNKDGLKYVEGDEASKSLSAKVSTSGDGLVRRAAVRNPITLLWGDFQEFVRDLLDGLEDMFLDFVDGAWKFVCEIGGQIYEAVLDCVNAVVGALEFIFDKVKVFFEDLIAWLGFLFNWDDIIRTQRVMKNLFKRYGENMVDSLDTAQDSISEMFESWEDKIAQWAGLPDPDNSQALGSFQSQKSSVGGASDPQCSWGSHHVKNGASASVSSVSNLGDSSGFGALLDGLKNMVESQADEVIGTVEQIKTDVIDQIQTLTPIEIVKRLVGISANLMLGVAKNVVVSVIEILKSIMQGVMNLLDATIEIPIISKIYKLVTGSNLSMLDLVCLVAAIPSTIIYKAIANKTPFPEGSATSSLMKASSIGSIRSQLAASPDVMERVVVTFNIAALVGSGVYVVLDQVQAANAIPVIGALSASSFLVFVAPAIAAAFAMPDTPTIRFNNAMTAIAVSKSFVDNVSPLRSNPLWTEAVGPGSETMINLLWTVPAITTIADVDGPHASDFVALGAALAAGLGGSLAFFDMKILAVSGPVKLVAELVAAGLNISYGALSLVYGSLLVLDL
ncbi:uncharacterized protein F5Z01DRAFT_262006 [Emericellopsis atlantica]|uniref:Uncharacterized protein n=1 Tax=Emericellopsis atlantica TaxID=2614577 RepID=A0A9P7ZHM1_9HYPO|nr:uncharacterized protein F5Z01DRAFT_262006 [Emericellopsis atlantica]KAG9251705.1 hypothetical protein F5Z01DRAFT_262006 [Emericellopsis atlantica]